ncbi:MAG: hypothetical protein WDM96_19280 [Lacunisphaera sp.]
MDITERKQAELQTGFLHDLSDRLVGLTDPARVKEMAQAAVGEFLGADRCYFFATDHSGIFVRIAQNGTGPALPTSPAATAWRISARRNSPTASVADATRVQDVTEHAATRRQVPAYASLQIRSLATSSFAQEDGSKLSLAVTTRNPRALDGAGAGPAREYHGPRLALHRAGARRRSRAPERAAVPGHRRFDQLRRLGLRRAGPQSLRQ